MGLFGFLFLAHVVPIPSTPWLSTPTEPYSQRQTTISVGVNFAWTPLTSDLRAARDPEAPSSAAPTPLSGGPRAGTAATAWDSAARCCLRLEQNQRNQRNERTLFAGSIPVRPEVCVCGALFFSQCLVCFCSRKSFLLGLFGVFLFEKSGSLFDWCVFVREKRFFCWGCLVCSCSRKAVVCLFGVFLFKKIVFCWGCLACFCSRKAVL